MVGTRAGEVKRVVGVKGVVRVKGGEGQGVWVMGIKGVVGVKGVGRWEVVLSRGWGGGGQGVGIGGGRVGVVGSGGRGLGWGW